MKIIVFFTLIVLSFNVSAQDYLDKIALQTCDCAKGISDTVSKNRLYMELGICMLTASGPYKKQLKKDHNINIDNIDQEGEAMGKLIGIKMATVCPDILLKIAGEEKSAEGQETFTGHVSKIEKDFFVVFTVSYEGKSLKFYWLTNAESNIELINRYEQLFDKEVKVKYRVTSLFDPKISDYRNFNLIEKIEQLSR